MASEIAPKVKFSPADERLSSLIKLKLMMRITETQTFFVLSKK